MKDSKLKISYLSNGAKVLSIPQSYEELETALGKYIDVIEGKYVFSIEEKYRKTIPSFFDNDTYNRFYADIASMNLAPKTRIVLQILQVEEYPVYEEVPELSLLEKCKGILEESSQTLKNSLITQCPYQSLMNSKQAYEDCIKAQAQAEEEAKAHALSFVPKELLCKICFNTAYTGHMYICCECVNYTLCARCYKCDLHDMNHMFIMITQPLEDDLRKYDCCVVDNGRSYAIDSSQGSVNVTAEVTLVNNGIEKWDRCTLQCVSYGESYLNGPKVIISEPIEKLKKINVKVNVVINTTGVFKSNWRIFNSSGLPFGELITFEFNIH